MFARAHCRGAWSVIAKNMENHAIETRGLSLLANYTPDYSVESANPHIEYYSLLYKSTTSCAHSVKGALL